MTSIIQNGKTVEEAVQAALVQLGANREDVEVEVIEEPKTGLFGLIGGRDALVKVSLIEESLVEQIFNTPLEQEKAPESKPAQKPAEKTFQKKTEKKSEPKVEVKAKSKVSLFSQEDKPAPLKPADKSSKEASEVETSEGKAAATQVSGAEFLKDLLEKSGFNVEVEESVDEEGNILLEIMGATDRETGVIIGKRGETLDAFQYITSLAMNRARASSDVYQRYILDINNYRERRRESLIRLAEKTSAKAKKYRRAMRLEPMNPYERRIVHSAIQSIAGVKTFSEGQEPYRRVIIKPDYDQD